MIPERIRYLRVSLALGLYLFLGGVAYAAECRDEKIVYALSPLGTAEYHDIGLVEFKGRKLRLITFRTEITGFHDLEKIYSDPQTDLPILVERDITWIFSKEYLTEEYSPPDNALTIKQFKDNKLTKEYHFKADGPIHNAILLPFSLRGISDLSLGFSLQVRLPDEFKVILSSIEEITVPAGKFRAYHFSSQPHKFDIWISYDKKRLPLAIKGMGGLDYSMYMLSYTPGLCQAEGSGQ